MPEEELSKSLKKLESLSPEVRDRAEAAAKAAIDSHLSVKMIDSRARVEDALKIVIESELANADRVLGGNGGNGGGGGGGGGFSRGLIFSKAGGFSKGVFFSKDKGSIVERPDERIILEDEVALKMFAERLSNIREVKDLRGTKNINQ
jgi:hypothetical protein